MQSIAMPIVVTKYSCPHYAEYCKANCCHKILMSTLCRVKYCKVNCCHKILMSH